MVCVARAGRGPLCAPCCCLREQRCVIKTAAAAGADRRPTRAHTPLNTHDTHTHTNNQPPNNTGYAAQSLLAAIGCIQFVSNVIFASLLLKERATRAVLAATALIVAGCVVLVSFGSHASKAYSVGELLAFYAHPVYITYLAASGAVVCGAAFLYWRGRKAVKCVCVCVCGAVAGWWCLLCVRARRGLGERAAAA